MISNYKDTLRRATIHDALACASIVDEWVEKTAEEPRLYDRDQLFSMIKNAIPAREMWVIGEPIEGYISYNPDLFQISALYVKFTGEGLGKILLDKVKHQRKYLQLWSHYFNTSAHKFYIREGFEATDRKEYGSDGIPELKFKWTEKL